MADEARDVYRYRYRPTKRMTRQERRRFDLETNRIIKRSVANVHRGWAHMRERGEITQEQEEELHRWLLTGGEEDYKRIMGR